MLVCIFSYNRGLFLQNCVASIERCLPGARIAVFDDNSDDPATIEALEQIQRQHTVSQPGNTGHHRLGGLYGNMQSALEYAADEEIVCYLQDDTQVVRHLSRAELSSISDIFEQDSKTGFVSPCFLRGRNRGRDARRIHYDPERALYFRSGGKHRVGDSFSALHMMKPRRLLESQWVYAAKEPDNDAKAGSIFGLMPYLKSPFAMWLPDVPTYRGKRKTLGLRIAEKRRQVGFYPFEFLSDDASVSLTARDEQALPFAEDFLSCRNGQPQTPWAYHPMQDYRWLQRLSNAELALRRWFGET